MKTIFNYITILSLLFAFVGCTEEEVMTFDGERGVNFVVYDAGYDKYTDDYENLVSEHNFITDYSTSKAMELDPYQIAIGVQLEGTYSEQPIRIKVKAEAVEGYEMAEVELPEEIIIEPGEYQANFVVACKQPLTYNKEYKTKLVFDYANSDVVAGTKERQAYIITAVDKAIWEDMYLESLEDWNQKISPYLGTAGEVKIRFIYAALARHIYWGSQNYSYVMVNESFYWAYGVNRPSWGFSATEMNLLRSELELYNTEHATPLAELDGTLVTFPDE